MKHVRLAELPIQEVSHNPLIKKQMMIGFKQLEPLVQFSRAVFPPGQSAPGHVHVDMVEVFYVERGRAVMRVNGVDHEFAQGECITIEPGENHALHNPGAEELAVIYFGLKTTAA